MQMLLPLAAAISCLPQGARWLGGGRMRDLAPRLCTPSPSPPPPPWGLQMSCWIGALLGYGEVPPCCSWMKILAACGSWCLGEVLKCSAVNVCLVLL